MVLIGDSLRSKMIAVFLYEHVDWRSSSEARPFIGYWFPGISMYEHPLSQTEAALDVDTLSGNSGEVCRSQENVQSFYCMFNYNLHFVCSSTHQTTYKYYKLLCI